MTIIEKLKNTLPEPFRDRFVYDSAERLNTLLDDGNYPLAFMTLVDSGTATDVAGRFSERMTISMHFATLADQDMDGETNEVLIDEMKRTALGEWLPNLQRADTLKVKGEPQTKRIYMQFGQYDVMLTAYVVNVTIEEVENYGICR